MVTISKLVFQRIIFRFYYRQNPMSKTVCPFNVVHFYTRYIILKLFSKYFSSSYFQIFFFISSSNSAEVRSASSARATVRKIDLHPTFRIGHVGGTASWTERYFTLTFQPEHGNFSVARKKPSDDQKREFDRSNLHALYTVYTYIYIYIECSLNIYIHKTMNKHYY